MQETVLLGEINAVGKGDLYTARLGQGERSADERHGALLRKTDSDATLERGIGWLEHGHDEIKTSPH